MTNELDMPSAVGRLAGLTLLVAEDNQINQMVLEDMLHSEGARWELAADGREAVERLRQHGAGYFDLALIDIQMPVMDGLEAARQLRALAPALPIVGQTAGDQPEDRARCLAAGMVDHIAKPIERELMVARILRHARKTQAPPSQERAPASPWQALEERYASQPVFVGQLLRTFLHSNSGLPRELRAALAQQDLSTLAGLAHSLKGMAASIAARGLHARSLAVEQAARQAAPDLSDLTDKLIADLEETLGQIQKRLDL